MTAASNTSFLTRSKSEIGSVVIRGASLSFALRAGGMIFGYLANVFLSRLLGLNGYGQYVVALGWALVLTLPARGGFDNVSLRYVTVYHETGALGPLRGFILISLSTVVVLSLVAGAILIAIGRPGGLGTTPLTLELAGLLVLPLALLGVLSPMMRTVQRIFASQFYDQLLRSLLLIALLGIAVLLHIRFTAAKAMAFNGVAAFIALIALAVHFRRVFATAFDASSDFSGWRKWFAMSVPMLVIGAAQELMNQVEVLFLGAFANSRQAALFAAAWRLASLTPFALAALTAIGGPLIASAYHRQASQELHHISTIVARVGIAFAVTVAAGLLICGKWLLGLFGAGFVAGYPVMSVLLVGGLVNAFTGIVAYLMVMTGRERAALIIFAATLVLSVTLNVVLIPRWQAIGAGVASSSATCAWNLAMLVYVRRSLGIDASAISRAPRELCA